MKPERLDSHPSSVAYHLPKVRQVMLFYEPNLLNCITSTPHFLSLIISAIIVITLPK